MYNIPSGDEWLWHCKQCLFTLKMPLHNIHMSSFIHLYRSDCAGIFCPEGWACFKGQFFIRLTWNILIFASENTKRIKLTSEDMERINCWIPIEYRWEWRHITSGVLSAKGQNFTPFWYYQKYYFLTLCRWDGSFDIAGSTCNWQTWKALQISHSLHLPQKI